MRNESEKHGTSAETAPATELQFTLLSSSVIPGRPPAPATKLDLWFTYHAPLPGQAARYESIRAEGRELAQMLVELCPPGGELDQALLCLRETVMWANAAIACRGERAEAGNEGERP